MLLCVKLNTDVETALKTVCILIEMGFQSIGGVDEPTCVVFWNDGEFSYEREHETYNQSGKTFIHTSLDSFIEDVKKYSDVKFKEVDVREMQSNKQQSLDVKIKKLHKDAVVPKYSRNGDAGLDLTAVSKDYDENGNICYRSIVTGKQIGRAHV